MVGRVRWPKNWGWGRRSDHYRDSATTLVSRNSGGAENVSMGNGFSPCMSNHERHLFRGHGLGSDNKIAFVFTIGGVENDDELSIP